MFSMMANIKAGAAQPTGERLVPVTLTSYTSFKLDGTPNPIDDKDDRTDNNRLQLARKGFNLFLVLIGALSDSKDKQAVKTQGEITEWRCWIGTVARQVFKNPAAHKIVSDAITEVPRETLEWCYKLSVETSKTILARGDVTTPLTMADIPKGHPLREISKQARFLHLPSRIVFDQFDFQHANTIGTHLVMAGYYSLIIFLMGRPPSTRYASISVNRPRNIQDVYHGRRTVAELSGSYRMNQNTIKLVSVAWDQNELIREAYLLQVLPTLHRAGDAAEGTMGIILHLMQYSQLSHVLAINEFLNHYPWVATMAGMHPYVITMTNGIAAWEKYNPTIRPFVKLLRRNLLGIMGSREVDPLARLAINILSRTQPSLTEHALHDCPPALIRAFNLREEAIRTSQASQLPPAVKTAAKIELDEDEIPQPED